MGRRRTSTEHAAAIAMTAPWVMAQRLSRDLLADPASLASALAWQRFALEKWTAAMQGGLAAWSVAAAWPWQAWSGRNALPAAAERMTAAALAPTAKRVAANARQLGRRRR